MNGPIVHQRGVDSRGKQLIPLGARASDLISNVRSTQWRLFVLITVRWPAAAQVRPCVPSFTLHATYYQIILVFILRSSKSCLLTFTPCTHLIFSSRLSISIFSSLLLFLHLFFLHPPLCLPSSQVGSIDCCHVTPHAFSTFLCLFLCTAAMLHEHYVFRRGALCCIKLRTSEKTWK